MPQPPIGRRSTWNTAVPMVGGDSAAAGVTTLAAGEEEESGTGVGAAVMTRLLATFLFEVRPNDGITYTSVVALLRVMSTLAIYLPARRSSKVEPLIALRAD